MPRKQNLSELIEQEAQKFTPSAAESAIEVTAQEVVEEIPASTEEPSEQTPESTVTKRSNPTKADLEITIKELQATLEKSAQQEISLYQKNEDLQSALSEQKSSVDRLTKELSEAKKTVLQLAEANSQIIEENKLLHQEKEKSTKEKQAIQKLEKEKPEKEAYNPLSYRKSHRLPEKLPAQQNESSDDFSANTWLYD